MKEEILVDQIDSLKDEVRKTRRIRSMIMDQMERNLEATKPQKGKDFDIVSSTCFTTTAADYELMSILDDCLIRIERLVSEMDV